MKKITVTISVIFFFGICDAQSQKDSIRIDSTQMERIEKMPMDTSNNKVPLTPLFQKDSVINKSIDDANPKNKEPK